MTRLTEEMVVARARQSDLSLVKKLNCWGADLSDVSILRRMTTVEVLALSINKINALSDFQYCRRLRELYLRKNIISNLSEVRYLRNLPALRILWMDENPCCKSPTYRLTVIRALPDLEKLDNVPVNPDEVEEASRKGMPIVDSDAEDDYEPELDTYEHSDRNGDRDDYRNGERETERNQEPYESHAVSSSNYGRPSALRRSPPATNGSRNQQDYDRQHEDNAPASQGYGRPSALPRSPPTVNGSSAQNQTSPVRQRCYSPANSDDQRYETPSSRSQYFERSASMGDELCSASQPNHSSNHTMVIQNPHPMTLRNPLNHQPESQDSNTGPVDGPTDIVVQRRSLQHSQSAHSIKQEYTPNGGEDRSGPTRNHHQQSQSARQSIDMTSPQSQHGESYYERPDRYSSQNLQSEQQYYQQQNQHQPPSNRQHTNQQDQWERDSIVSSAKDREILGSTGQIASAVMADHKGFTRRPMTRNSNLLSAVLCLVKELDYNSLEVAEMAVRCRMDELANRP